MGRCCDPATRLLNAIDSNFAATALRANADDGWHWRRLDKLVGSQQSYPLVISIWLSPLWIIRREIWNLICFRFSCHRICSDYMWSTLWGKYISRCGHLLFISYSNPFSVTMVADRANGKNQANFSEASYSQSFSALNTFDVGTTCEQASVLWT